MTDTAPDATLDRAFELCRRITERHARTYYLAARLLPDRQRPAIHALYGFARQVDDVIDEGDVDPVVQAAFVDTVEQELRDALEHGARPADPIILALSTTIIRHGIPHQYFWDFLASMRMDIPGTPEHRDRYRTLAELHEYTYGSAAVIGLQLLPVFGVDTRPAREGAAALGDAFQLTNFLRDVADDFRRGRIYLPLAELAAFGVDEAMLARCVATGEATPQARRAIAHLIAITRSYYRTAESGCTELPTEARMCVETALILYRGILDEIESADYNVFARRAVVPQRTRVAVAAPRMARAALAGARTGRTSNS
ncbi:phytoene/squalene synthase family protein [Hoyosella sp. G463]|uniref:Phytoene/squalene synthase family protein n=1 Tax=Lolliginicoccus lacisalsi TaxID=2742202 RepID=A0A927PN49_9ACTN|nr:phytoene/squalene synthase family protein [Lolliginicoccus lacisalsi]